MERNRWKYLLVFSAKAGIASRTPAEVRVKALTALRLNTPDLDLGFFSWGFLHLLFRVGLLIVFTAIQFRAGTRNHPHEAL
jgi:hypothetical protein